MTMNAIPESIATLGAAAEGNIIFSNTVFPRVYSRPTHSGSSGQEILLIRASL